MLHKKTTRKTSQRPSPVRWLIIAGNFIILVAVGGFVLSNRSASQTVRANTLNGIVSTASASSSPMDTLSSSQIALTAAQLAGLPELTAIHNQADSDSLVLSVPPSDSSALAKPQLVATAQKSKQDITHYTTVAGDSLDSLSSKFGVTTDSLRWSNNLSGSTVSTGIKLEIPPVNGIVYSVKNGDTPASIAQKFSADENQIIALNDAEINGLQVGEEIIVPNGKIAPVLSYGNYIPAYGSFTANYVGNGYDYGYCTYYVASKVSVPTNWGNAVTWDEYARLSGWTVSKTPVVGAIAQSHTLSFLGHVAYVEAVSADGTMIKFSDMNNLAGWGRVGFSDWRPASTFQNYIYH